MSDTDAIASKWRECVDTRSKHSGNLIYRADDQLSVRADSLRAILDEREALLAKIASLTAERDAIRAKTDEVNTDNAWLRGELQTAYQVIDELPDGVLDGVEPTKLMRSMEHADKHEHVASKMDDLRVAAQKAERRVDLLRAGIAAIRAKTIEEAATLVEQSDGVWLKDIADRIRALAATSSP